MYVFFSLQWYLLFPTDKIKCEQGGKDHSQVDLCFLIRSYFFSDTLSTAARLCWAHTIWIYLDTR